MISIIASPKSKPTLGQARGSGYRAHGRYRGVVGHWLMAEGGGGTLYDLSRFKNDGTLAAAAAAPTWTQGRSGQALSFDGGDRVTITNSTSLTYNSMSALAISLWVKFNSTVGAQAIFSQWNSAAANRAVIIELDTNLAFGVNAFDSFAVSAVANLTSWNHIVGMWRAGVAVDLYVNGVLLNSDTSSVPTSIVNNTIPHAIGARSLSAVNFDEFTNGLIDDVRIYNRALTPQEILSLYQDPFLEFAPSRHVWFTQAVAAATRYPHRQILAGVG